MATPKQRSPTRLPVMKLILVAALLMLSVGTAVAQVSILDGDTIKVSGITYRLWGIDAPETKQACADGWPAGVEAARKLADLVKDKAIFCEDRGRDRYGRSIGLCRAEGVDIQSAMVRSGMAWAFTRYSSDYVVEEQAAVLAGVGVHAHNCEEAWEWRRRPQ